ncbi:PfkB family carbohydrate kinase [Virgibacillus profundi]|uniref:PfkB family carbohydrate kinase n=1 Tax=Virgibacillus profundi TaxID=2024555 RepID=UPI0013FE4505|nr:PfkB family carbohydrate kinase [Virgibacillus profundi]
MGEQDCLIVTSDRTEKAPTFSVEKVDAIGAGDSFTGALAVAFLEGKSIIKEAEFANLIGSNCKKYDPG